MEPGPGAAPAIAAAVASESSAATKPSSESKPETESRLHKLSQRLKGIGDGARSLIDCPKAFIKQPKRWIAFVGAGVVFVTFVAKEGFRDDLKDVVSAFENAQRSFDMQEQNTRMMGLMTEIRRRVVALNDQSLPKTSPGVGRISQQSALAEQTREVVQLLRQTLDNFATLAGKLPKNKQRDSDLAQCQAALAVTSDFYGKTLGVISSVDASVQSSTRDLTAKELQQLADSQTAYIGTQHQAALRIAAFGTRVLGEAPMYREEEERRYAWWNNASRYLYALGWGLALVGKIYGAEVSGLA
jgi:hypothetical protein